MSDSNFPQSYSAILARLQQRLDEPAPSRIQILTGPRQAGKTTLLLELAEGLGSRAIYHAADSPEAAAPGSWEALWKQAHAASTRPSVLMIDEVHVIPDWARRLKGEWDGVLRRKERLHVVVTGSSALRIGPDIRESLAGRFERLTLAHWQAAELSSRFRLSKKVAAELLVTLGGYPGVVRYRKDLPRATAYLRNAIIEPAIGRDVLAMAAVRKPAMLRQVFAAAVASPAQIISLLKLRGSLDDPGALETIAHYLGILEEAFLASPAQKFSEKPLRRRSAPPKIIVLNNGLLVAMDPRGFPVSSEDPSRLGAWIENACAAAAWNAGQSVTYWREEPMEVDFVTEGSWGTFAVEVKTGRLRRTDLTGLLEFCTRNSRFRPMVIGTASNRADVPATITFTSWQDFLHDGPPSG